MSYKNRLNIIIPLYNVEKWIGRCLKSVQGQNYSNFRCYVVNDISTDNTDQKILNQIKDDDRFVYINNKEKKYALKNIYDTIKDEEFDDENIHKKYHKERLKTNLIALSLGGHRTLELLKLSYGERLKIKTFCALRRESLLKLLGI